MMLKTSHAAKCHAFIDATLVLQGCGVLSNLSPPVWTSSAARTEKNVSHAEETAFKMEQLNLT